VLPPCRLPASQCKFYCFIIQYARVKLKLLGMLRISGWPGIRPDNPAFFISGIRPDNGFDLLDIRPDTGTENSLISGKIEEIPISICEIYKNVFLKSLQF
jgi:hypothetical protein